MSEQTPAEWLEEQFNDRTNEHARPHANRRGLFTVKHDHAPIDCSEFASCFIDAARWPHPRSDLLMGIESRTNETYRALMLEGVETRNEEAA